MAHILVEPPETEPVTLAEAKSHCRVDISDDDTTISNMIIAARDMAEEMDWRAYITQTWELWLDVWPAGDTIALPRPPLQSVTSVKHYDAADAEGTLATSAYIVDVVSQPGRLVLRDGQSWPSTTLRRVNGVVVTFVAGWANAAAVPQRVKHALLLLVGHWYENRETVLVGTISAEIAFAVSSLLGIDSAKHF